MSEKQPLTFQGPGHSEGGRQVMMQNLLGDKGLLAEEVTPKEQGVGLDGGTLSTNSSSTCQGTHGAEAVLR